MAKLVAVSHGIVPEAHQRDHDGHDRDRDRGRDKGKPDSDRGFSDGVPPSAEAPSQKKHDQQPWQEQQRDGNQEMGFAAKHPVKVAATRRVKPDDHRVKPREPQHEGHDRHRRGGRDQERASIGEDAPAGRVKPSAMPKLTRTSTKLHLAMMPSPMTRPSTTARAAVCRSI